MAESTEQRSQLQNRDRAMQMLKSRIYALERAIQEAAKDAQAAGKAKWLAQGTIYPDVIESLSPHKKGGKSSTIKSHHNVGGLPERMNLKLLEPLRFLFKD